jgi:hypothetical protein
LFNWEDHGWGTEVITLWNNELIRWAVAVPSKLWGTNEDDEDGDDEDADDELFEELLESCCCDAFNCVMFTLPIISSSSFTDDNGEVDFVFESNQMAGKNEREDS